MKNIRDEGIKVRLALSKSEQPFLPSELFGATSLIVLTDKGTNFKGV